MNNKIFVYISHPDPLTSWDGLLLIVLFLAVYLVFYFTKKSKSKFQKIFIRFWIISMVTMSTIGIYDKYSYNHNVEQSIKNKTHSIIEGKIKNFHEMPFSGHDTESFSVNNIKFEILFTETTINKKTLFYEYTKNRGGPIVKNGQKVKIHYIENRWKNEIIKLWVYE